MDIIFKRIKNLASPELDLTNDEIIILQNLANGVKQNDIIEWTPETVSRKLKKARTRNGIKDTETLLMRFKRLKDIEAPHS